MLKKIKMNELVRVEVSRPRNVQQHNFYWALCRLVAMNHETLTNERMVDQAIKIRAGHVDLVRIGDDIVKIPRSIAFVFKTRGKRGRSVVQGPHHQYRKQQPQPCHKQARRLHHHQPENYVAISSNESIHGGMTKQRNHWILVAERASGTPHHWTVNEAGMDSNVC